MDKQRILIVHFNKYVRQEEIAKFRGAIIRSIGEADLLFHNHQEDGYRYAYPMIQYKRIDKKAAIVCIGEGAEIMSKYFSTPNYTIRLGTEDVLLEVESISLNKLEVQLTDTLFSYRISNWLPLNQENYRQYMSMDSLADKYKMLEHILIGNMLSFAKSLGIFLEEQIVCNITTVESSHILPFKGVAMNAFDLSFTCNFSIPDYIGLGKGVSHGFGVVIRREK